MQLWDWIKWEAIQSCANNQLASRLSYLEAVDGFQNCPPPSVARFAVITGNQDFDSAARLAVMPVSCARSFSVHTKVGRLLIVCGTFDKFTGLYMGEAVQGTSLLQQQDRTCSGRQLRGLCLPVKQIIANKEASGLFTANLSWQSKKVKMFWHCSAGERWDG